MSEIKMVDVYTVSGVGNDNPLQYSCLENFMERGVWWAAVHGGHKKLDTMEYTHTEYSTIIILLRERYICLLEKEMTTHSSILAWRIPRTGPPGSLQSMGSQRVGHYV